MTPLATEFVLIVSGQLLTRRLSTNGLACAMMLVYRSYLYLYLPETLVFIIAEKLDAAQLAYEQRLEAESRSSGICELTVTLFFQTLKTEIRITKACGLLAVILLKSN